MPVKTESDLWDGLDEMLFALQGTLPKRSVFTRIESGATSLGISDIEYVLPPWHGWIELKVCALPFPGRPYSPRSVFTMQQAAWLLAHHQPENCLRSWLLLGVVKDNRWNHFVLFPPPQALRLRDNAKSPLAYEMIGGLGGVIRVETLKDVVGQLQSQGEGVSP